MKLVDYRETGANRMIQDCLDYGLPEPEFKDIGTSIVVIFRKSRLTEELMDKLGLNERQKKTVKFLKAQEKTTRSAYEKRFDISERTANRELSNLVKTGVLEKKGSGRSVYYVLSETSPNLTKKVQKRVTKYVLPCCPKIARRRVSPNKWEMIKWLEK